MHNDQGDGDLAQLIIQMLLIFKFYIWEHFHLKLKLKLSNMYTYISLLHHTGKQPNP